MLIRTLQPQQECLPPAYRVRSPHSIPPSIRSKYDATCDFISFPPCLLANGLLPRLPPPDIGTPALPRYLHPRNVQFLVDNVSLDSTGEFIQYLSPSRLSTICHDSRRYSRAIFSYSVAACHPRLYDSTNTPRRDMLHHVSPFLYKEQTKSHQGHTTRDITRAVISDIG